MMTNKTKLIIKSSETNWLEKALKQYTEKVPFQFIDDAELGLNEKDLRSAVNLIKAAKGKGRISWKQIVSLLTGLGISGAGLWIVAAAIADPEPTTKLGLLITGGLVLTVMGGYGSLSSLGIKFSVIARTPFGNTFEIHPK
jgi:hypothetical protein